MERNINLIGSFSTDWIRYSDYELMEDTSGQLYIKPADNAAFSMYNPFDVAEDLLIDILNIGDHAQRCLKDHSKRSMEEIKRQVLIFAKKYGLLGVISASVYNRDVIGDDEVLIIKNNYAGLKEKTCKTKNYLQLFTPFAQDGDLEIRTYRNGVDLKKAEDSPKFFGKRPIVMDLIFSRFYTEKLDWFLRFSAMLSEHFRQLSLYRTSADFLTEQVTVLSDMFQANKIGFTISQLEKTIISWEFDSLKSAIETIYAFAVTDENIWLSRCSHCNRFYLAISEREKYCSPVCRNRANVKKSRQRKKEKEAGI